MILEDLQKFILHLGKRESKMCSKGWQVELFLSRKENEMN